MYQYLESKWLCPNCVMPSVTATETGETLRYIHVHTRTLPKQLSRLSQVDAAALQLYLYHV